MRSSFSYSSRCDRIEIHSPDAIENAPATSPAMPASSTMLLLLVPPATPMTSEKFDTRPSFTPNTAARSTPPTSAAVAALGPGDAPALGDALHGGDGAARRPFLVHHHVGGLGVGLVAVGLRRLGAQHQRQHRLGAEEAGEEAQRAHAERRARRARLDAGVAQELLPVRGVTFLRGGEGEEHVASLRIGVLGEPAEQRAAVDLVGIHVAQTRDARLVEGCVGPRSPHDATHSRSRTSRS